MLKTENKYFIYDRPIQKNWKYFVKKILYIVLSIYYKFWMGINRPRTKLEKKYKVSAISIFKNEAQYMHEWIEYNHLVGIEHFYLYNNNSEDDYQFVLKPYMEIGLVTLIQWPKNHAQMECYNDGIRRFKNESHWLCFIDIDEFIVPNKMNSVYDFLKPFEKNRGSVIVYWKMFCSSGLMDRERNGLVCEDFTVCWDKMDDIGKCFYNTSYDFNSESTYNSALHHCMWTSYKGKNLPPVNSSGSFCFWGFNPVNSTEFPIQINHYFTKSFQEYKEKKSKGDVYFKKNPHDEDYFYRHEMKCNSIDYHIYKYLIKLKLAMKKG